MRAPRKRARSIDHPARGDETGSPVRQSFERLSFTPRITARRVKRRAIACSAYTSLEVLKNKEKKKRRKRGKKMGEGGKRAKRRTEIRETRRVFYTLRTDMTRCRNRSILQKVSSDTFICCCLKGLNHARYASHSEPRSKDNTKVVRCNRGP